MNVVKLYLGIKRTTRNVIEEQSWTQDLMSHHGGSAFFMYKASSTAIRIPRNTQ